MKSIQQNTTRTGLLAALKAFFDHQSAKNARRRQAKLIREAKRKIHKSEMDVARWKDYIEFKVFDGVQGDSIEPDTIHGNTLKIHFSKKEWGEDSEGSIASFFRAVCSDDQGRWFELSGRPGCYADLYRINSAMAYEKANGHKKLVELANTPLPEGCSL